MGHSAKLDSNWNLIEFSLYFGFIYIYIVTVLWLRHNIVQNNSNNTILLKKLLL